MRILKLTLYKTSLDREYQNVIDTDPDYTLDSTKYKEQVLDSFYSPLPIYDGAIKAVKESDGGATISISKLHEELETYGYNYAAIYTGVQWVFYFIVGMESLNDSNEPSMLIHLERDAWANNIEYFTNHNYNDRQQVIRCHQNRIYDSGNKYYPYYTPSNDSSQFTTKVLEHYVNLGGGGNVVWCGVRFSKDTIATGSAGTAIASTLKNILTTIPDGISKLDSIIDKISNGVPLIESLKMTIDVEQELNDVLNAGGWQTISDLSLVGGSIFEAGAPMFYFPCAIVNDVNDGVPDYSLAFTCTYNDIVNGQVSSSYDFQALSTINSLFSFQSEEIIESTLTITPPFEYTVSGSNIYVGTGVITSTNVLRNSLGTKIIFPYEASTNTLRYIVSVPNIDETVVYNYEYKSPLYGFEVNDTIGQSYFDPYQPYENVSTFEPRIYCSPFTKLYSVLGQAQVEIPVVQDRVRITNKLLVGNKSEPLLSVFLNDQLISGFNSIGSTGALPTSYDKWKDFLLSSAMNMGNTVLGLSQGQGVSTTTRHYDKHGSPTVSARYDRSGNLLGTTSRTPGGVSINETIKTSTRGGAGVGITRGIMDTVQEGLAITSQATRPTVPSVKSNNNIEKFIPKIVLERFTDFTEMNDILGELYLYGYKYPEVQSVKKNCRVWFDYCETSKCSLPMIKNFRDREILESAFDRGITKWHYGPYGLQHDFLRNLNNVERQYINPVDASYYFDFQQEEDAMKNLGTLGDIVEWKQVNVLYGENYIQDEYGVQTKAKQSKGFYFESTLPNLNDGYTFTAAIKLGDKNITAYGDEPANTLLFNMSDSTNPASQLLSISYNNDTDRIYACREDTGLTWDNVKGKTLTVSAFNAGGSYYGCYLSVFLDGNVILDRVHWNAVSTQNHRYFQFLTNMKGGFIERFAFWADGQGEVVWDSTKAKQHLI